MKEGRLKEAKIMVVVVEGRGSAVGAVQVRILREKCSGVRS